MENLKRGNDYKIFTKLYDEDGVIQPLSSFSNIEVIFKSNSGSIIRTLKYSNSVADGKLFEYDTTTLKYYIETRDSDNYDLINVWIKVQYADSDTSDGNFDLLYLDETYSINR